MTLFEQGFYYAVLLGIFAFTNGGFSNGDQNGKLPAAHEAGSVCQKIKYIWISLSNKRQGEKIPENLDTYLLWNYKG